MEFLHLEGRAVLEDEVGRPCSPGGQQYVVDFGPVLRRHDTEWEQDKREGNGKLCSAS